MARTMPDTISSGVLRDTLEPFWAVDLLFDSPNQLYFWSGIGDLTLDGITYTGAGDLLQISDIRESSDIAAYGATLTLSGIPTFIPDALDDYALGDLRPVLVMDFDAGVYETDATARRSSVGALAQSEPYQGRKCIVRFGVMGFDTYPEYTIGGTPPALVMDFEAGVYEQSASSLGSSTAAFPIFSGEMDQMSVEMGPETATVSLQVESRLIDLRRPRLRRYTDKDQQSRYSGDLAFEFVTRLQDENLEWGG